MLNAQCSMLNAALWGRCVESASPLVPPQALAEALRRQSSRTKRRTEMAVSFIRIFQTAGRFVQNRTKTELVVFLKPIEN